MSSTRTELRAARAGIPRALKTTVGGAKRRASLQGAITPEATFQKQVVGLKNRVRLWTQNGHQGDLLKDVWEPFSRCLRAFARRSGLNANATYEHTSSAYRDLADLIAIYHATVEVASQGQEVVDPEILKVLGVLARDASLMEDAVRWTEAALEQMKVSGSTSASRSALLVRIAAFSLRQYGKETPEINVVPVLGRAAEALTGSIRGSSTELDGLLHDVSALRREAVSCITRQNQSIERGDGSLDPDVRVVKLCRTLVYNSLHVFHRSLGSRMDTDESRKYVSRDEARSKTFAKAVQATIDSSLSLLKTSISADDLDWPTLDGILQDCMSLAPLLDDISAEEGHDDDQRKILKTVATKVSNMYWAYSLQLQKNKDELASTDLIHCLQRSIASARAATADDSPVPLLGVKLERLGRVYISAGAATKGRSTLVESLQAQIQEGVLQRSAEFAARKSLKKLASQLNGGSLFEKTLLALLRTYAKPPVQRNPFPSLLDDIGPSDQLRGCLLEWQLMLLSGLLSSSRSFQGLQPLLVATADELLQIFTTQMYPLRRMRMLISLLSVLASNEALFQSEFGRRIRDEALTLASSTVVEDDLSAYGDHFKATLNLLLTLGEPAPKVEKIKESLVVWAQIVESANSLVQLEDGVDDLDFLHSQLCSTVEFLAMKGLVNLAIPTLNLILRIRALQQSQPSCELVLKLSDLAWQYLKLGYSGKAGVALTKAHQAIQRSSVSNEANLRWNLVYAEYVLILGNSEKCVDHLTASQKIAQDSPELENGRGPTATLTKRTETTRLTADACYAFSRLASEKGSWSEALSFAKRCVKLNYRVWASLEHRSRKALMKPTTEASESEGDLPAGETSLASCSTSHLPTVMSTTHSSLNGSSFWSLVPSLIRSLRHLSQLYARLGQLQEALYYAEQGQKIMEAVDATVLISENLAVLGGLYFRSGQTDKGAELLARAKILSNQQERSAVQVQIHCLDGHLHRLRGEVEKERADYIQADQVLDQLVQSSTMKKIDHFSTASSSLEENMASFSLQDDPALKELSAPRLNRRVQGRGGKPKKEPKSEQSSLASGECIELLSLRGNVLRLRATIELLARKFDVAASLLSQAESCSLDTHGTVMQRIGLSSQLLRQSLEEMAHDAVFCVVEESTTLFPSVLTTTKKNLKHRGELSPGKSHHHLEKSPNRPQVKMIGKPKKTSPRSFTDCLSHARDGLLEVLNIATRQCSTSTIRTVSSALSNLTLLLAATLSSRTIVIRPIMPMVYAETARILATRREKVTIQIEKQVMSREEELKWPDPTELALSSSRDELHLDATGFQKHYVDIIPPRWAVLSISLSDNMEELTISRLQAGQTPFTLRLPLTRHNSRDADEEVFGFKQARDELVKIIDAANFTAHDARDMTKKGAKSRWWAEREALDAKLRDLLLNIENIWLGGFRGVFSQTQRPPELLSRFHRSFQNILDRYLPSRQKAPKRSHAEQIHLAPHILGLLVGLGIPSDEDELDEPLMDLLYFVVDILQFHGEHNAYDEIDFDQIVIETKDALRAYHAALSAVGTDQSGSHTILILDKGLHVFPWEALPCLDGLSVSRLPSLDCLRERILLQQSQWNNDHEIHAGFRIGRGNGSYILNPSGDLSSTQTTFESDLKSLSTWNSIVQRDPTEEEMKHSLENRELFLYFGHGSGAQYIRARTIKTLDRCAVTLLMGCSSGCLTDAGEFELYGTPKNYLHAGW
ncbi:MAG: Strongly-conserved Zn-finger binding protein (TFIIIA) [Watsoniomyces obsoletus]|nr:MAG: Strongly-conserved Zn-finger binding protein (TFIIIA) [Watsoniomyces obsoletus]